METSADDPSGFWSFTTVRMRHHATTLSATLIQAEIFWVWMRGTEWKKRNDCFFDRCVVTSQCEAAWLLSEDVTDVAVEKSSVIMLHWVGRVSDNAPADACTHTYTRTANHVIYNCLSLVSFTLVWSGSRVQRLKDNIHYFYLDFKSCGFFFFTYTQFLYNI